MLNHLHIVVISTITALLCACGPAQQVPATQRDKVTSKSKSEARTPAPTPDRQAYTLVMLGDSLTAGLGLTPMDAFPQIVQNDFKAKSGQKITIRNAGVSGDTSASGLARFDWSVGPETNGVLIALGANDMLNGLDPAQTRENLAAMIVKARTRALDVYLAGMRAAPNLGTDYADKFDRIYQDLSIEYCVPFFGFLLQPLANVDGTAINQGLIQGDGLHPTKEGAARIGHALSPWLDTQLNTKHIPCTTKTE